MEGEDSSDEDIPLDQLVPNLVQDTQDGPEALGPVSLCWFQFLSSYC
jgi:hypothetical protein